jgi:hypothetical protein
MKKIFLLLFISPILLEAQNVGIGNPSPTEKLDVNGNINLTGTIKANGVDGTAGQLLMKNSNGNLVWGDISNFKNMATYLSAGAFSWTVPDTVTSIIVEVTGGGAGGTIWGGGGGGAYITGLLTVTPGSSVSVSIGTGGAGSAGGSSGAGGISQVSYSGTTLSATGGLAAFFDNPNMAYSAVGGNITVSPATFRNYFGVGGANGKMNNVNFVQRSATSFFEISSGGNGGGPGYNRESGMRGSYYVYDISAAATFRRQTAESNIRAWPGSGGGGGYSLISVGGFGGGSSGADGMVIIHY